MAKTASRKLFQLIKTLSGSEKRYFKLFAAKANLEKENKYLQLFNALEQQEDYDECTLKNEIYGSGAIESRKFSELKAYLYRLILKSLHAYDEKTSVDFKLKSLLQSVRVLYKRSLYSDAKEILKKAKKLAGKYESFLATLEILEWEKHIAYAESDVAFLDNQLATINEEVKTCLSNIENEAAYWNLFFQILIERKKEAVLRTEEKKEELSKRIHGVMGRHVPQTHKAQVLRHRIFGLFHHAVGDHLAFYEEHKKLLALIQSRDYLLREDITVYIAVMSNLLMSCGMLRRYDELNLYLEQFKNLNTKSVVDELKIFTQYYLHKLVLCSETGAFSEGTKIVEACEKERQLFDKQLFLANFYFQYGYIYFGAGRYGKALDWINELRNLPKSIVRQDLQSIAQIVYLLIHYEMDNVRLLDHLLRSSYRFLKKRDRLYEVEKRLLGFFRKLPKIITKKELRSEFLKLREDFVEIAKKPSEGIILKYFNFFAWLESKIEEEDFAEIIKKQHRASLQKSKQLIE